jgi:hypothetical protein
LKKKKGINKIFFLTLNLNQYSLKTKSAAPFLCFLCLSSLRFFSMLHNY